MSLWWSIGSLMVHQLISPFTRLSLLHLLRVCLPLVPFVCPLFSPWAYFSRCQDPLKDKGVHISIVGPGGGSSPKPKIKTNRGTWCMLSGSIMWGHVMGHVTLWHELKSWQFVWYMALDISVLLHLCSEALGVCQSFKQRYMCAPHHKHLFSSHMHVVTFNKTAASRLITWLYFKACLSLPWATTCKAHDPSVSDNTKRLKI